jgi:hypothetical protein
MPSTLNSVPEAMAISEIAALWLGLILGVSFLATPVKFRVRSLERAVALEVGHATFKLFNRIEWITLAALVIATLLLGASISLHVEVAAIILVLLLQTFWLRPALGHRTAAIIAGQSPSVSAHHIFYITGELAKCALLGVIALQPLLFL